VTTRSGRPLVERDRSDGLSATWGMGLNPSRCRSLLAVTLLLIGLIVLSPGPPDPEGQVWLAELVERGHVAGWLPGFVTFGLVEWLCNVVLFLPAGFFATGAVSPMRRRWVPLLGVALSGSIELIQLGLPGRVTSILDVVANGLGGLLGALALQWLLRKRWRERSRKNPDSGPFDRPGRVR
jgi:hypothetical protein